MPAMHICNPLFVIILKVSKYLSDSGYIEERAKEMAKVYSSEYVNKNNLTVVVKMFPVHIKRLVLNPLFMLLQFSLSACQGQNS